MGRQLPPGSRVDIRRAACLCCLVVLVGPLHPACSGPQEDLLSELADPSPVKRAGAVRALARQGNEEAYRLVSKALEDPSPVVRAAVVLALPLFQTIDALPALTRASRDADPEVRAAAVKVLSASVEPKRQKLLVDMLVAGEERLAIRSAIHAALDGQGLTAEQQADLLSRAGLERCRKRWEQSRGTDRARLVLAAGRSVSADGLGLVLAGLDDQNTEVLLAALAVLDGRGGEEALRKLVRLGSDEAVAVRLGALRALKKFGPPSAALVQSFLRDASAEVRLAALAELERQGGPPDPGALCGLLGDPDERVLLRAAAVAGALEIGCDPGAFRPILQAGAAPRQLLGLRALAQIRLPAVREFLRREVLARATPALRPFVAAALLRAGGSGAPLVRLVRAELARRLKEIETWEAGWLAGRITATGEGAEGEAASTPFEATAKDERPAPKTKLSDQEIALVLADHQLPPAGAQTPRGVADLLARFPERASGPRQVRLFVATFDRDAPQLLDLIRGLLAAQPDAAMPALVKALRLRSGALVDAASRAITERALKVPLDDALIARLLSRFLEAPADVADLALGVLALGEADRVAAPIERLLPELPFGKQERLIRTLGALKARRSAKALIDLLTGASAGTAARALADLGETDALPPLKKALEQAGPAAELEILLALARLGNREIVPRVAEKLDDLEPEIRLAAVRILRATGGEEALSAIRRARTDVDRLVRAEAEEALNSKRSGE